MLTGLDLVRFYERQYGPFIGMAPADQAIWVRYLMQGGNLYAPFTYNLRVGDGLQMPPDSSEMDRKTAWALTTKRIDVMCASADALRIIEVKQYAGASAVGQLITYRDLYRKTYNPVHNLEMWLITDQLQPDMKPVLIQSGIFWAEVGH